MKKLVAIGLPALAAAIVLWVLRPIPIPGTGVVAVDGSVRLRSLGITGYELDDGETTLLLDPVFTRPGLGALLTGPIDADPRLFPQWLQRADFILLNHSHYDHAIDAAAIALRTGATVVGTESACNLARARGVPEARVRVANPGEVLQLGTFKVEVYETRHPPIAGIVDPFSGVIAPDAGALWFWAYRMDRTLFFRLTTRDTRIWFLPSALTPDTPLQGEAETLILGLAGAKVDAALAARLMAATQAGVVIPAHFDNFFLPRARGLTRLSFIDVAAARALFARAQWWVLDYDQSVLLPRRPALR